MSIPVIDVLMPLGKFPVVMAEHVGVGEASLNEVLNATAIELEKKASKAYVDEQISAIPHPDVTKSYVDSNFAKKTEIPTVPTKTSQLTNDSGFLTQHQSLSEYAKKSEIPVVPNKVSSFQNDAGYLTQHQDISGKADVESVNAVNSKVDSVKTEQDALSARMDAFTSLEEGSTTGDAELTDIRVQVNGKTANSAGSAVRNQVTDLKSDIEIAGCVSEFPEITWSQGYVKTDGTFDIANEAWRKSNYISAANIEKLIVNGEFAKLNPGWNFAFFDAGKTYIPESGSKVDSTVTLTNYEVIIPKNARFFVISNIASYIDSVIVKTANSIINSATLKEITRTNSVIDAISVKKSLTSSITESYTIMYNTDNDYARITYNDSRAFNPVPVKVKKGDIISLSIADNSNVRLAVVFLSAVNKPIISSEVDTLWNKTGKSEFVSNYDGSIVIYFRYANNASVSGITTAIKNDVDAYVISNDAEMPLIPALIGGRLAGNNTSVSVVDDPLTFHTDFIPVHAGEKYKISCEIAGLVRDSNALGVCGFSDAKLDSFTGWIFNIELAGETTNNWYTYTDYEITIPVGVTYISMSSRCVNKWDRLSDVSCWIYKSSTDKELIDKMLSVSAGTSQFGGLKGVAFGSSLTARAKYDGYYSYLRQLEKLSGITFDNQAVGGYCMYHESGRSIYGEVTEYTGYADKQIAIIEGDVNGWHTGKALGTYKDTVENTSCGCLYNAIKYIKEQNPNIMVVFISDHYGKLDIAGDDARTDKVINGLTQYEYYEEMTKLCKYRGVICINESEISNINEMNPKYLDDWIHLNALGEIQSGNAIWKALSNHTMMV